MVRLEIAIDSKNIDDLDFDAFTEYCCLTTQSMFCLILLASFVAVSLLVIGDKLSPPSSTITSQVPQLLSIHPVEIDSQTDQMRGRESLLRVHLLDTLDHREERT